MAGIAVLLSTLLVAASPAAPSLTPETPKQGDMLVLRLPKGEGDAMRAWFGEEEIPIAAVGSGWQGIWAVDILQPPGPLEITGVTVKDGKSEVWTLSFDVKNAGFPEQHITLEDDTHVHLSKANLERAGRERKDVIAVFQKRTDRKWSGSFKHPLNANPNGGRFGSRRFINGEPRNPHSGADYGAPKGEPVHSANAGKVVLADEHFFAGNSVFVDHGDGLVSMYFHLDKILVKKGQEVKKGEVIGKVGATGRATGPHLHYGINFRGKRVNPASVMAHDLE